MHLNTTTSMITITMPTIIAVYTITITATTAAAVTILKREMALNPLLTIPTPPFFLTLDYENYTILCTIFTNSEPCYYATLGDCWFPSLLRKLRTFRASSPQSSRSEEQGR